MSDKKQQLYRYLVENSFDSPPTVRELCEALDIKSTSQVHKLLHELEEDGLININKGKRRNIALPGRGNSISVPLLGTVAAGIPILAQQNIEDFVTFDNPGSDNSDLFALRVKGESMINAGILNGDIVVVKSAPTAMDGEIVVALIGEEATVKRIYRHKDGIELRAENPAFAPLYPEEVSVLGKVVAVIRYYS